MTISIPQLRLEKRGLLGDFLAPISRSINSETRRRILFQHRLSTESLSSQDVSLVWETHAIGVHARLGFPRHRPLGPRSYGVSSPIRTRLPKSWSHRWSSTSSDALVLSKRCVPPPEPPPYSSTSRQASTRDRIVCERLSPNPHSSRNPNLRPSPELLSSLSPSACLVMFWL